MRRSFSAGGVVISNGGQVLVVSQGTSWSLPKGHIEASETARQAAEREIKEETGLDSLAFIEELGSYERFKIAINGIGEDTSDKKHITLFLFTTKEQHLAPEDPHNPEACWVAPDKVSALLTHSKDKAFFESILATVSEFVSSKK
ncbi:MAG TPA: NUDIX domain-containing protein [Candidatus Saccharimonadales bacterium]|jgi:ADP-ribose pyrophosphatase YjhB (NUDIX family)